MSILTAADIPLDHCDSVQVGRCIVTTAYLNSERPRGRIRHNIVKVVDVQTFEGAEVDEAELQHLAQLGLPARFTSKGLPHTEKAARPSAAPSQPSPTCSALGDRAASRSGRVSSQTDFKLPADPASGIAIDNSLTSLRIGADGDQGGGSRKQEQWLQAVEPASGKPYYFQRGGTPQWQPPPPGAQLLPPPFAWSAPACRGSPPHASASQLAADAPANQRATSSADDSPTARSSNGAEPTGSGSAPSAPAPPPAPTAAEAVAAARAHGQAEAPVDIAPASAAVTEDVAAAPEAAPVAAGRTPVPPASDAVSSGAADNRIEPASLPTPDGGGGGGSQAEGEWVRGPLPRALWKYWMQRYTLWSRFDDGVLMDQEGWFSVTPEAVARHHAARCACNVLLDPFAGVGGNVIRFAETCGWVVAGDLSADRCSLIQHNAAVHGVQQRIDVRCQDFWQITTEVKADIVFLSPPWGGPQYTTQPSFSVAPCLGSMGASLADLLDASRAALRSTTDDIMPHDGSAAEVADAATSESASTTSKGSDQTGRPPRRGVVCFLPKNTDLRQLSELVPEGQTLEVERNLLDGFFKGVTVYFWTSILS